MVILGGMVTSYCEKNVANNCNHSSVSSEQNKKILLLLLLKHEFMVRSCAKSKDFALIVQYAICNMHLKWNVNKN